MRSENFDYRNLPSYFYALRISEIEILAAKLQLLF